MLKNRTVYFVDVFAIHKRVKFMREIIIGLLSVTSLATAQAEPFEVTLQKSQIETFRTFTTYHDSASAANHLLLKVSGLSSNCTKGLFLDASLNKSSISQLLSAYHASTPIKLGYESSIVSPWGDNRYCAITYVDY